jgi:hypothetical protein
VVPNPETCTAVPIGPDDICPLAVFPLAPLALIMRSIEILVWKGHIGSKNIKVSAVLIDARDPYMVK